MIKVKNIYYMLSYAFRELERSEFESCGKEDFENIHDLFSEILILGLNIQLRRGLRKTYQNVAGELGTVRGKVELTDTIKNVSMMRHKLVCSYDVFTIDEPLNRIIKATLCLLLKTDISVVRKKAIRAKLRVLSEVSDISLYDADWCVRYGRNDDIYRMLISICRLMYEGMLINYDGEDKLQGFIDEERESALYEKFILEYYRKHHPELNANASYINWNLGEENEGIQFLPRMKSDITLTFPDGRILIIDAKYYSHSMLVHFDKHLLYSGNIYQIFTYVKNKDVHGDGSVTGLLLYGKTDEDITPDTRFDMGGNIIEAKTLDLNADFSDIKYQLENIISKF